MGRQLESGGAEALILCANTMHIVATQVQENIGIPLLHIVDAVAHEIEKQKLHKVALLGTRFTMEHDFYPNRLRDFGIETVTPEVAGREFIHQSIFEELGKEIIREETRERYLEIIGELQDRGAEGVILACTEIPLLIKQEHCLIPVFDSTLLHARYAVDFALTKDAPGGVKIGDSLLGSMSKLAHDVLPGDPFRLL